MFPMGDFPVGATVPFPFDTYDSNGGSVTITGLAVTDIEIYKDGSTTQRASDNGYVLLDTDGIDFDGATGLHGFSVDFSDNSDAGFYAAGHWYWLNVNAITCDGQTVRFTYFFTIGMLLRPATAGRTVVVDSAGLIDATAVKIGPTGAATAQTAADVGKLGQLLAPIDSGTAQAGGGNTITLRAGASATNDYYAGCLIFIVSGTGAGGRPGLCTSYNGSTKSATVSPGWSYTVDNTSVYAVFPLGQAILGLLPQSSGTFNLGNLLTNVAQLFGSTTAASNAKLFFDGTGYAGTNNVIPTVTNLTNAPTAGDLTATMKASVTAAVPTANANADALLDRASGVETGWTVRQILRIIAAWFGGKRSGQPLAPVIRDINDTKNRISASLDANGNTTGSVTIDVS